MFSSIFGLPTHPLVVHLVVVFVPLAALAGLAVAVWPAARARYAPWALAIATVALISIPVATQSGERLEPHIPASALVRRHTELGDQLLPFAALLWLALAGIVVLGLPAVRRRLAPTALRVAGVTAMVVTVAAAASSGVQIVRIGHSGAQAAWHDVGSASSAKGR